MRTTIGLAMMAAASPLAGQAPTPPLAECALPLIAPAPAPWRGWDRPGPLVAAERGDVKSRVPLAPGRAVAVTFAPSRAVVSAVPPARAAPPVSYGGMLTLVAPTPGTYRIAIGARAWIDVVGGGVLRASVAHDHGAPCSGIVKTVDFLLPAGPATIEISGAPTPVATVMAVRVS